MIAIIVFHAVMLLLALGLALRAVPARVVSQTLAYLHKSIGITTPSSEQVRSVALIWIGSAVLTVDGCLFFLFFITSMSNSGR